MFFTDLHIPTVAKKNSYHELSYFDHKDNDKSLDSIKHPHDSHFFVAF